MPQRQVSRAPSGPGTGPAEVRSAQKQAMAQVEGGSRNLPDISPSNMKGTEKPKCAGWGRPRRKKLVTRV